MLRNYIKKLLQRNTSVYENVGKVFVLVAVIIIASTQITHASFSMTSFLGIPSVGDFMVQMVAEFVNINLQIASWILAVAGFLLNFSMSITLNIKAFVEATPAIYTVWKAIRDISGMFIIFMLLYAAIKLILGQDAKIGGLIKTIVMAGILINFSFFITGLGIDVSNVVSSQLYNAIAPANKLTGVESLNPSRVKEYLSDGGISDIFMQSLKIVSLYDVKSLQVKNNGEILSPSIKIILMGTVGIVIMYTAAISFFLAALAFIVRFVILLFLLAFSPIWFAAYAIPQLGEYAKKWSGTYQSQLTFMPVYLLLMYFALSVLSSNSLFGSAYAGDLTSVDAWYANFLTIAVNAALVIIMLNAPLLAAISLGAKMPEWAKKAGAEDIWKKVGGFAGSKFIGGTAARLDASIDKSRFGISRLGNTLLGKDIRNATLGAAAKSKFGGSRSYEETGKAQKEQTKRQREVARNLKFDSLLRSGSKDSAAFKAALDAMSPKERQSLKATDLINPLVLRHLKRDDFEAIKKSEDMSLEDQKKVAEGRKKLFENAIISADITADPDSMELVKDMAKNYEPKDIASMDERFLTNPNLIAHMSAEHLKKIAEGNASDETKATIANTILNWQTARENPGGKRHRAVGWVGKNRAEWLPPVP